MLVVGGANVLIIGKTSALLLDHVLLLSLLLLVSFVVFLELVVDQLGKLVNLLSQDSSALIKALTDHLTDLSVEEAEAPVAKPTDASQTLLTVNFISERGAY